MQFRLFASCAVVAIALAGTPLAALADGPLSVTIGPAFVTQSTARTIGGTVQTNVGAAYDFGPKTIVPVRASLQFDYAGGASNGGALRDYGVGIAGRLTTPICIGAGVSLYSVSASIPSGTSVSKTGIGSNYFIGQKIIDVPGGIDISLQATYRQVPQVNGIDPSGLAVGLRIGL
ncbi:MAG: hypothetical protein GIW95_07325 [Candidatus Eremiobacteraeota bacterium]|nr:hypothetical protein [Candidatus Eremiobacteraeota bacterium]